MQVTRIECNVGFTINTGDFQNVKAMVGMIAELDRNEDPDAAYAELRGKVLANAVAMGADAHPDRVRGLLGNHTGAPAASVLPGAQPGLAAPTEAAKPRGRPKKDEAAPKTNGAADGPALLGATDIGGLGNEAGLDGLGADDGDDLLGGAEAEVEVTPDMLSSRLREVLQKKGKPALMELFKKVGATDLKTTPNAKFKDLFALAGAQLA